MKWGNVKALDLERAVEPIAKQLGMTVSVRYAPIAHGFVLTPSIELITLGTCTIAEDVLFESRHVADLLLQVLTDLQRVAFNHVHEHIAQHAYRGGHYALTGADKGLLHDMYTRASRDVYREGGAPGDMVQKYQALMDRMFA